MGVEIEVKFRATNEQLDKVFQDFPGLWRTISMESTYYDTPDGALSQKHYTLRHRKENDESICTLKAPVQGFGRGEYETACDDIYEAVPVLCKLSGLEQMLLPLRRQLVCVCGAKFTRLAKTLTLPDCTVELALDRGVLTGGGRSVDLCELEAELKSGSQEAMLTFARTLFTQYGLVLEKQSKFRRALALSRGE